MRNLVLKAAMGFTIGCFNGALILAALNAVRGNKAEIALQKVLVSIGGVVWTALLMDATDPALDGLLRKVGLAKDE